MKAFSITGWSGSGKTTLIAAIITQFKQKNKKVVAVKHCPDKYTLQPESKDTAKFLEAGAGEVCLVSKNEFINMRRLNKGEDIFEMLENQYPDCDILLLEGLRKPGIPVIEVFDPGKQTNLKNTLDELSAVVSDQPVSGAVPCFNRNDINGITRFMEVYNG
ncbi:MAG: molybdopterin-guanine dinucleotide biosynthesis protein B [bacterium]|nr:molybdopterin-guanine dinucleotide biosynthesis protein B [bacterium]